MSFHDPDSHPFFVCVCFLGPQRRRCSPEREAGDLLAAPPLSSSPKHRSQQSLSSERNDSFSDGGGDAYESDDSAYYEQRTDVPTRENSYFGLTATSPTPIDVGAARNSTASDGSVSANTNPSIEDQLNLITSFGTSSAPVSSHGGKSNGTMPRVSSEPGLPQDLAHSVSTSHSAHSSPNSQHGMNARDYQKKFGDASRDLLNFVSTELSGRPSNNKSHQSKKQVLVKFPVWRVDRFGERASRTISIEFEYPKNAGNSDSSRPIRRLKLTRSVTSPLAFQGRFYTLDLDADCRVSLYYDQTILSLRIEDHNGKLFGVHRGSQARTYQFHSADDYDNFVSELNNVTTNLLPIEARPCEALPRGGVDSLSEEERAEFKLDGRNMSRESRCVKFTQCLSAFFNSNRSLGLYEPEYFDNEFTVDWASTLRSFTTLWCGLAITLRANRAQTVWKKHVFRV